MVCNSCTTASLQEHGGELSNDVLRRKPRVSIPVGAQVCSGAVEGHEQVLKLLLVGISEGLGAQQADMFVPHLEAPPAHDLVPSPRLRARVIANLVRAVRHHGLVVRAELSHSEAERLAVCSRVQHHVARPNEAGLGLRLHHRWQVNDVSPCWAEPFRVEKEEERLWPALRDAVYHRVHETKVECAGASMAAKDHRVLSDPQLLSQVVADRLGGVHDKRNDWHVAAAHGGADACHRAAPGDGGVEYCVNVHAYAGLHELVDQARRRGRTAALAMRLDVKVEATLFTQPAASLLW